MDKKQPKRMVGIYLPQRLSEWMKEYSEETGVTLSRIVQNALQKYYKDEIEEWESQRE